ncbi:nucleotide exchange factor GrpE [Patescibacteria group bacterium]|nr:nucleotide exchange factor GrpE [Patescibacteria group bacterium]
MDEEKKENEIERITKERDEYLDGWKRAKADLINYKKEENSRLENLIKFGNQSMILELLAVLDSFDLGLSIIDEHDPAKRGIILIKNQLEDILKRHGLEKIQVEKGDKLDTSIHEAVEEVAAESPPGTISEEVTAGYKLHGKTIRPSRVKVSKGQNQ